MSLDLLRKLQKLALFLLIVFLPLSSIPKKFALPGFGGNLSNYFLFIGVLLVLYEWFKYGLEVEYKAKLFFVLYIIWQFICLIHGLYYFEFNEMLTLNQIPNLNVVLGKMSNYGLVVDELVAIKFWILLKSSRNILLLNSIVFLLCFYIWHLYKNNFTEAFMDIRKAFMYLIIIMSIYSFFELLFLKFNLSFAKDILITINPYLYDPMISHGWHPPLIWKNQLRSIFTEPSFFGIVGALCLPLLWSYILEPNNKFIILFMNFYFTFMIAATNARTAVILALGELLLLYLYNIVLKKREYFIKTTVVLVISLFAFGTNIVDFKSFIPVSKSFNDIIVAQKEYKEIRKSNITIENIVVKKANDYVSKNITSVTNKKSRSNEARFSNLVANLNTIKEYPFMGVGTGLKDAYLDRNFTLEARKNGEVKLWSKYLHKEGVLKSGFPSLNKYADVAVQNGIIGLLLYISVAVHLTWKLLQRRKLLCDDYRVIILVIATIGLLIAQLSSAYFVVCNGIVWGLLYCKLEEIRKVESR